MGATLSYPYRDNSGGAEVQRIPAERSLMDYQTRNEFEHFCALAEIEEDPEKFAEISRNIFRILDEKHTHLIRQRPANRIRFPAVLSDVTGKAARGATR